MLDYTYNRIDYMGISSRPDVDGKNGDDTAFVRYDKFITSLIMPQGILPGSYANPPMADKNRYPHLWRSGQGRAHIRQKNQSSATQIGETGVRTGGILIYSGVHEEFHIFKTEGFEERGNIPLANTSTRGDSGSPIWIWDNIEKKWLLGGAISRSDEFQTSYYAFYQPYLFEDLIQKWTNPIIHLNERTLGWKDNQIGIHPLQEVQGYGSGGEKTQAKDIVLQGGGTINLMQNIDQDSGGIYFLADKSKSQTHYTITSNMGVGDKNTPFSWKGAGLHIEEGVEVHWQVKGIAGIKDPSGRPGAYTSPPDSLHKIGKGTLSVEVANGGWLNLGEGKVILNTQEETFETILMVSGRATLEMIEGQGKALNPDTLFFHSRGGILDIKGNDLTFKVIKASDNGAKIINTGGKKARLEIKKEFKNAFDQEILGAGPLAYHGSIGDNIEIYKNLKSQAPCPTSGAICQVGYGEDVTVFDGNIYNPNGNIDHTNGKLVLQGHPVIHAYLSPTDPNQAKVREEIKRLRGEDVYDRPSYLSQEDWETRLFVLDNIKVSQKENPSTFVLGRNAILLTDIDAQGTQAYFGGNTDVYIDRYDGENVQKSNTGNAIEYTFNQLLEKGQSRKDNTFYFEGNLTGANASNFLVSNTETNPLRFGSFMGLSRETLGSSQKSVSYKITLDPASTFNANYVSFYGNNEAIFEVLPTQSLQSSTAPAPKPPIPATPILPSHSSIRHLSLYGDVSSKIAGNLTIGGMDHLKQVEVTPSFDSSISFDNLNSKLEVLRGVLTLNPGTKLIFNGSISLAWLYENNATYKIRFPLITSVEDIQDQRNTKSKGNKDIIFTDSYTKSFNPLSYSENKEIGFYFKRPQEMEDKLQEALNQYPQYRPVLEAIVKTNQKGEIPFQEIVVDALIYQMHQNSNLERFLSTTDETLDNLAHLGIDLSVESLRNTKRVNTQKNTLLRLQARLENMRVDPLKRLKELRELERLGALEKLERSERLGELEGLERLETLEELGELGEEHLSPSQTNLRVVNMQTSPSSKQFNANYASLPRYALNTQEFAEVAVGSDASFDFTLDKKEGLSKPHHLWFSSNAFYGKNYGDLILGGLNGGYDYLFKENAQEFLSVGFSLNYAYGHYAQKQVLEQVQSVIAGLHTQTYQDNHEVMIDVYTGVNVSKNVLKSDLGFVNTSVDSKNVLFNTSLLYQYRFVLPKESYHALKPSMSLEYSYYQIEAVDFHYFSLKQEKQSVPTLGMGLEYDYGFKGLTQMLSWMLNYNFLTLENRRVGLGTESLGYATKMQKLTMEIGYSGSYDLQKDWKIEYAIQTQVGLMPVGGFGLSGNLGVSWRF